VRQVEGIKNSILRVLPQSLVVAKIQHFEACMFVKCICQAHDSPVPHTRHNIYFRYLWSLWDVCCNGWLVGRECGYEILGVERAGYLCDMGLLVRYGVTCAICNAYLCDMGTCAICNAYLSDMLFSDRSKVMRPRLFRKPEASIFAPALVISCTCSGVCVEQRFVVDRRFYQIAHKQTAGGRLVFGFCA